MAAHAKLSPSGSARWLNCPGSVRMSEGIESVSGDAAFRGTVIHQAGENILRGKECHAGISIVVDGANEAQWLHKDMYDEAKHYADYVFKLAERDPDAEIHPEMKIDLSDLSENQFGHSDAVVLENGTLHVIDLKTGAGLVNACDNTQLMLYAYGAYREFEMFCDIENVCLHIVQNNDRTGGDKSNHHVMPAEELLEWAIDVAIPGAKRALEPDAPCIPGDKQCQWCPAAGICPALMNEVQDLFDDLTDNHQDENPKHLGDVVPLETALGLYGSLSLIDTWKKAIEDRIFNELTEGKKVPGYKLVKKVKHKKWTDEIAAYNQLKAWEKLDDIAPRKLVTPNQAEKILGKMTAPKAAKFNALWIRPEGELTIALESDKRPAEQPVIDMFDDLDEIDDLFDKNDPTEIGKGAQVEDDEEL